MDDTDEANRMVGKLLAETDSIEERAPGPYGYEKVETKEYKRGFYFRIFDADDNAIASCSWEGHAKLIVRLMNRGLSVTP